jgi:PAS domain S-box-containing protein
MPAVPGKRSERDSQPGHLEAFRARLAAFERELSATGTPSDQLSDRFGELQMALEEVEVADETLAQQTEELIAAREALEGERLRYRNLFHFAPYGYLATDLVGTILEANRSALDALQVSDNAVRGKPLAVFVLEADLPRFRSLIRRLEGGESVSDWEVRLCPRRRPVFPALVTVSRQEVAAASPPVLLWALRDISSLKETEAALQASEERLRHTQRLEAVGRLAGGIAHSFNNLLAAVAFHVDLLGEGLAAHPESRSLLKHVEEIRETGERAAGLASQLLAFSRRQVLQPRPMRLNEVVATMEPMVRELIGEHIELVLRLSPSAGAILVDLSQLEQVLLNLFVNARDAMPAGGRCTVETSAVEVKADDPAPVAGLQPGCYARLVVADTGTGMIPEVKARIFEPFFTTKERGKGTGLGLATVYGIVKQSGGEIRVDSDLGEGARFEVYLPSSTAQPEPIEWRAPAKEKQRGSEVVLLVEDEINIRLAACEVLERQGYRVLTAAEGGEALRIGIGHTGPLHLLVTDVIMPGMSGRQLADRLVAARPDLKVLYMSGYPEDAIADMAGLGRHSFLQKPFPPAQFLQAVRDALDGTPALVAHAPGTGGAAADR